MSYLTYYGNTSTGTKIKWRYFTLRIKKSTLIFTIIEQQLMKTSTTQTVFRIILGLLMTLAGVGHLTFQRQEFLAQVPRWLPDNPTFMDFIVLSSGVVEMALGLSMIFFSKQKVKIGIL